MGMLGSYVGIKSLIMIKVIQRMPVYKRNGLLLFLLIKYVHVVLSLHVPLLPDWVPIEFKVGVSLYLVVTFSIAELFI